MYPELTHNIIPQSMIDQLRILLGGSDLPQSIPLSILHRI